MYTTVIGEELDKLTELAQGTCVEIGSYLGASACAIAENADKLYCIDTWESDPKTRYDPPRGTIYDNFLENTKKYRDKIIPIRDYSINAVTYLFETEIDFLFIDGDHSQKGVYMDWCLYRPLLGYGGVVAFHDYAWPSVRYVVDKFVDVSVSGNLTNLFWGEV